MRVKEKTIVTISDKYRVAIDLHNHTLEIFDPEYTNSQGKRVKAKWVEMGHFPNMRQAIRRAIEVESLDGFSCDLAQYVDRLEALDRKYYEVIR